MKTGFICASGFNLVATATRNDKRLIAVVLGAQSSAQRAVRAAQLLERGFNGNRLAWLKPSLGLVDQLAPVDASPPNLRDEMCGPKRKRPAAEDEYTTSHQRRRQRQRQHDSGAVAMYSAVLQAPVHHMKGSDLLAAAPRRRRGDRLYRAGAQWRRDLEADAAETGGKRRARKEEKARRGRSSPQADARRHGRHKGDKKATRRPSQACLGQAGSSKPPPRRSRQKRSRAKQAAAKPSSDAGPRSAGGEGRRQIRRRKPRPSPRASRRASPRAIPGQGQTGRKPAASPIRRNPAAAPKS